MIKNDLFGWEARLFGGEASPHAPHVDETLSHYHVSVLYVIGVQHISYITLFLYQLLLHRKNNNNNNNKKHANVLIESCQLYLNQVIMEALNRK